MSSAIANGTNGAANGTNGVNGTNGDHGSQSQVQYFDLAYDSGDSQDSAMKLILTLKPDWASDDSKVEFIRFTDGITNTLLKAVNRRPGLSKPDIDRESVLLRAYGNGTALIIDRDREAENHELLMKHKLATTLMARFQNGMLYGFIPGTVAQAQDLSNTSILKAIARRLAQWHATVPCLPDNHGHHKDEINRRNSINARPTPDARSPQDMIANVAPGKPAPNVWTTMQKWILALPNDTDARRERQALLQSELEDMVKSLSQRPGLGKNGVRMR